MHKPFLQPRVTCSSCCQPLQRRGISLSFSKTHPPAAKGRTNPPLVPEGAVNPIPGGSAGGVKRGAETFTFFSSSSRAWRPARLAVLGRELSGTWLSRSRSKSAELLRVRGGFVSHTAGCRGVPSPPPQPVPTAPTHVRCPPAPGWRDESPSPSLLSGVSQPL